MNDIISKRVSLVELFYDLAFVYAISKITEMLHHPQEDIFLVIGMYAQFLFVIISIMQVWLYQTLYINIFGKNRIIDNIGVFISMYSVIYLSNNINTEWSITFTNYNIAMLVMLANMIFLYFYERTKDSSPFIFILGSEFLLILVGLLLGYKQGIYFAVIGGLIGFFCPLIVYKKFNAERVNFPHLVERMELITIITFGEIVVTITSYFRGPMYSFTPIVVFISLASLFGVYVFQMEKIVNHKQVSSGFVLMYSHVVLVASLLSLTVAMIYMGNSSISREFIEVFSMIHLSIVYLCILVNSVYSKKSLIIKRTEFFVMVLLFIFGSLLSYILRRSSVGHMLGSMYINGMELAYVLYLYKNKKSKKIG